MFKSYAIIMASALFFSACATQKPVIFSEKSSLPSTSIKPEKLLLIYDISLIYPFIQPALLYSKEEIIERDYGAVAKIIAQKVKDQGIQADYQIKTNTIEALPKDNYSHVLIEKMVSVKRVTERSTYSDHQYFGNYQWQAKLFEIDSVFQKQIYTQTYMSDGLSCFNSLSIQVGKDTCRNDYIELLLGHLSQIGIKKYSK